MESNRQAKASLTVWPYEGGCVGPVALAKAVIGVGILAHDCVVIDMSDDGVRLHVAGFDVPDEFVLLLTGDGVVRESKYRVVWRRGHELGGQVCQCCPIWPCLAELVLTRADGER
jgi:hypothetical protein